MQPAPPYRAPPPQGHSADAEAVLLAFHRRYRGRQRALLVPLPIVASVVTPALIYFRETRKLSDGFSASWSFGVAATAATLTSFLIFCVAKTLALAVLNPLRRRHTQSVACRLGINAESVDEIFL